MKRATVAVHGAPTAFGSLQIVLEGSPQSTPSRASRELSRTPADTPPIPDQFEAQSDPGCSFEPQQHRCPKAIFQHLMDLCAGLVGKLERGSNQQLTLR